MLLLQNLVFFSEASQGRNTAVRKLDSNLKTGVAKIGKVIYHQIFLSDRTNQKGIMV